MKSVSENIQLSKDLFHQIPGAQSASLHPELPQGVLKVDSCSSTVCNLCRKNEWMQVTRPCPTRCHPMDYSLPGFSVHGIFQAGIPEWVAISFSKGSFWPRDWTQVSFYAGIFFTLWATNARCLVTGNTHGKCQFVVNQNKTKNTP